MENIDVREKLQAAFEEFKQTHKELSERYKSITPNTVKKPSKTQPYSKKPRSTNKKYSILIK